MRFIKEATWRFLSIKVTDDLIVCFTANEPAKQELEGVLDLHRFVQELVDYRPARYLIDFREHYVAIPPKVISHIAKDPVINASKIAEALVVKSLANRILVNFYLTVKKPMIPAKMFNNKESALKWLNTFPPHSKIDAENASILQE